MYNNQQQQLQEAQFIEFKPLYVQNSTDSSDPTNSQPSSQNCLKNEESLFRKGDDGNNGFIGDRMIPLRGGGNANNNITQAIQNFEFSSNLQSYPQSAQEAILVESSHKMNSHRHIFLPHYQNQNSSLQTTSKGHLINFQHPSILQFNTLGTNTVKENQEVYQNVNLFTELRELNSERYRSTNQLHSEIMKKQKIFQVTYSNFAALEAEGISKQDDYYHIFQWGYNGYCAVAIKNFVYLFSPVMDQETSQLQPCSAQHNVTCLKWMEQISKNNNHSNNGQTGYCSVLAIATNDPEKPLQIWECNHKQCLRIIRNKIETPFTSLEWHNSKLIGVTYDGKIVVNEVTIQHSEIISRQIFGIGRDHLHHLSFNSTKEYLAVTGGHNVQMIKWIKGEGIMEEVKLENMGLTEIESTEIIHQVFWSDVLSYLFAIVASNLKEKVYKGSENSVNNSNEVSDILFYNADNQQELLKCEFDQKIVTMKWSKHRYHNEYEVQQIVFTGLQNGSIAVLLVKGVQQIKCQILQMLSVQDGPVLYIDESPDGEYMCSVAIDEVFFVWKREVRNSNANNIILTDNEVEQSIKMLRSDQYAQIR